MECDHRGKGQGKRTILRYFIFLHRSLSYVCFVYFAAIAQVCINLYRQHVMSFDGVKGDPSPTLLRKYREEDEEEAWRKGQSRSWRFSFHKYFINFFYLLLLLLLLFFIIFFYTFLPTTFTHTHTHDPRPTTSTHYPRPTTFSYTLYTVIGVKGEPSPTWLRKDEEEAVTKRAIKELEIFVS